MIVRDSDSILLSYAAETCVGDFPLSSDANSLSLSTRPLRSNRLIVSPVGPNSVSNRWISPLDSKDLIALSTVLLVTPMRLAIVGTLGYGQSPSSLHQCARRLRITTISVADSFSRFCDRIKTSGTAVKPVNPPVTAPCHRSRMSDSTFCEVLSRVRRILTDSSGYDSRGLRRECRKLLMLPASGCHVRSFVLPVSCRNSI